MRVVIQFYADEEQRQIEWSGPSTAPSVGDVIQTEFGSVLVYERRWIRSDELIVSCDEIVTPLPKKSDSSLDFWPGWPTPSISSQYRELLERAAHEQAPLRNASERQAASELTWLGMVHATANGGSSFEINARGLEVLQKDRDHRMIEKNSLSDAQLRVLRDAAGGSARVRGNDIKIARLLVEKSLADLSTENKIALTSFGRELLAIYDRTPKRWF